MKQLSSGQKLMIATVSMFLTGMPELAVAEPYTASQSATKPQVIETEMDTITATVAAVDYVNRILTLKEHDGHIITMSVGPEVVRLKEIRKGDVIKIDYMDAIAIFIQTADQKSASVEESKSVIVRNKTKKPSGVMTDTDTVTATVLSINAEKRSAVLKGPKGNDFKISIASDVKNLGNIKKGDKVMVKITRSIAVTVSKP
ncbi:MAG: hypothetical protein WCG19_07310 [Chlorobiaceae bacterium]